MSEITTANNELIVVKQLPVIEDQLLAVKDVILQRVETALSLECTEDTYKEIKKVRSDLNKEFSLLEQRRKEIKKAILQPYESFEKTYQECAGDPYATADRKLREKIAEVEDGLKNQKKADLEAYFSEYRQSLNIDEDFVQLSDTRIKVGLSDSKTSLHKQAAEFLDGIGKDLAVINTLGNSDEILAEYRKTFNISAAMFTVDARHKQIEAERIRREERAAAEAAAKSSEEAVEKIVIKPDSETVSIPIKKEAEPPIEPQKFEATFTVKGTIEQLKALKAFLNDGGYEYEC